ncbi:hypothetical protein ACOME3_010032 [Neoechinorhynchus agilis]
MKNVYISALCSTSILFNLIGRLGFNLYLKVTFTDSQSGKSYIIKAQGGVRQLELCLFIFNILFNVSNGLIVATIAFQNAAEACRIYLNYFIGKNWNLVWIILTLVTSLLFVTYFILLVDIGLPIVKRQPFATFLTICFVNVLASYMFNIIMLIMSNRLS